MFFLSENILKSILDRQFSKIITLISALSHTADFKEDDFGQKLEHEFLCYASKDY